MFTIREVDLSQEEEQDFLWRSSLDRDLRPLLIPKFGPDHWHIKEQSRDDFLAELAKRRRRRSFLIRSNETIVGEVSYIPNAAQLVKPIADTAWLSIYVRDPAERGKGAGQFAMIFLEDHCRLLDFKRLELGVFGFNPGARRFYESLGYSECGRDQIPCYYEGTFHEGVHLEKWLTEKPFRYGAVAVVVDTEGRVLLGKKTARDEGSYWQMPQGGVESGELPTETALRELFEECGLKLEKEDVVGKTALTHSYEWPRPLRKDSDLYLGQTQIYVHLRLESHRKCELKSSRDFSEYEFCDPLTVLARAIEFKKAAYENALRELRLRKGPANS